MMDRKTTVVACAMSLHKDSKIHVIHKQNAGQGLARNDGLNIAKGHYVLFIDSDDFIEPDTCEKLSDRMEREQADLCASAIRSRRRRASCFTGRS